MRKILVVFLSVLLLFMAGCNGDDTTSGKKNTSEKNDSNSNTTMSGESTDNVNKENFNEDDSYEEQYSYDTNGILSGSVSISQLRADIDDLGNDGSYIDFMKGKGGADAEAYALRKKILSTKDDVRQSGTKYYFSPSGNDANDGLSPETPFRTFNVIAMLELKKGDSLLLERGSVFRIDGTLRLSSDISLGAYGEGEKPQIWGSAQNYAGKNLWKPSEYKNIWVLDFTRSDAGVLVINHGEKFGRKVYYLQQLQKNNDFVHTSGVLYLYSDKNPNDYDSIEIGCNMSLISVPAGSENVSISNICLKYTGGHGIQTGGSVKNITIIGCEIGWIGGSVQGITDNVTMYGNGIEFWDASENITVKNNWIYQVYDAGLTFQGKGPFRNIAFSENLIEYTTMSFEYWSTTHDRDIIGILIDKNIIRFSGYGWGAVRKSNGRTAHINVGHTPTDYSNLEVIITNNIFDCSYQAIFRVPWINYKPENQRYTISSNSYYQRSRKGKNDLGFGGEENIAFNFGVPGSVSYPSTATNQSELETAVKVVDSNPKIIRWIN